MHTIERTLRTFLLNKKKNKKIKVLILSGPVTTSTFTI